MIPRRARGRLLVAHGPPAGWTPGWSPATPVRRCRCGGRVTARSSRFTKCEHGHVQIVAKPTPPPAPGPLPAPPADFSRVLRRLRLLEGGFVRDARKGRRPPPRAVELAILATKKLGEAYPDRAEALAVALPWLSRRAGGGRAA